jgi:hypothetical protein
MIRVTQVGSKTHPRPKAGMHSGPRRNAVGSKPYRPKKPDHPKTCVELTPPKCTLLAAQCPQGNYRALLQQPGSVPPRHSLCSNMEMSCQLRLACQSGDTLAQLTNLQAQRYVTSVTLSHTSVPTYPRSSSSPLEPKRQVPNTQHMPNMQVASPKNPTRTGCGQTYKVVCPTPNRTTCTVQATVGKKKP